MSNSINKRLEKLTGIMPGPALRQLPGKTIGRSKRERAPRFTLYRHFNRDGALLYVGVSERWSRRHRDHDRDSFWFDEIACVTFEFFGDAFAMMVAEGEAIRTELPLYNRHLNPFAEQ